MTLRSACTMSVYHDCKECMYHESVLCMSLLAPLQYSGTTAIVAPLQYSGTTAIVAPLQYSGTTRWWSCAETVQVSDHKA